jgi:GNAT superfamily N-acetyltransferase
MPEELNAYREVLKDGITIRQMQTGDAQQLEALQYIVFPNLAEEEILHAEQYLRHLEIFPQGQYVVADQEKIIGATTTMRYHFNEAEQLHHTFFETMGSGWLTTHEPEGEWLYGLDVSVHPGYRGKGFAKALYRARQYTCRALGLKGQITVGMLNGYFKVKDEISIEEYYKKVRSGEIFDPTVSVQKKIGFQIIGLMKDYLNDPTCGNAGALIVLDASKEV